MAVEVGSGREATSEDVAAVAAEEKNFDCVECCRRLAIAGLSSSCQFVDLRLNSPNFRSTLPNQETTYFAILHRHEEHLVVRVFLTQLVFLIQLDSFFP